MEAINIQKIGDYTIEIHQDCEIDPRLDYDNLCTMACFHRKHILGDQVQKNFPWPNTQKGHDDFYKWLKENKENVVYKHLQLYDHSGLTISTSTGYPYNDRWDSSSVGVIYVEKEKILKEFGFKEWSEEAEKKAFEIIDAEVETTDLVLSGHVYGYIIKDHLNEEVESCWGYIGFSNYCMEEAEKLVKNIIKKDEEWAEKAQRTTVSITLDVLHTPEMPEDVVIRKTKERINSSIAENHIDILK